MGELGQNSDNFQLLEQMILNGQMAKCLKRYGATRRSRTGDLLITKNNIHFFNLTEPYPT